MLQKAGRIQVISYLYILLPVFIFLLSWTKLIIGIPLSIFLAAILYKMCSQEKKAKNTIEISGIKWWKISIVIAIVLFWVLLSGIAGIAFQNKDHNCRNAIYETLVRMDWPAVDFNIGEMVACLFIISVSGYLQQYSEKPLAFRLDTIFKSFGLF